MIKGHAEIILTDVNTKNEEVYHEDNIVTNALQELINFNYGGITYIKKMYPMYKKTIGGIFLFDENIDENPNILTAPSNVDLVGHAGSDAYIGANNQRGSLNDSESEELSNGFKFVWDFTTNQANGEIKCICLTSNAAGKVGFGTKEIDKSEYSIESLLSPLTTASSDNFYIQSHAMAGNFYFEVTHNSGSILIKKYKIPYTEFSLKSSLFTGKEMKQAIYKTGVSSLDAVSIFTYNGELYVLTISRSNSFLRMYRFNIDTLELVNEFNLDDKISFYSTYSGIKFRINEGFIYICNRSTNELLKINMSNTTDTKNITIPKYGMDAFFSFNNRISGHNFMLTNDILSHFSTSSSYSSYPSYVNDIYKGLIYYAATYGTYTFFANLAYLVTINNLATPVVKTADKTMKIIYTITEV